MASVQHAASRPWWAVTEPPRQHPGRSNRGNAAAQTLRYLGAASLLAVGAIHAQQYYDYYYYEVPTIGTLFLLNFIAAGVVGTILIAPVRRLPHGLGDIILALAALTAIGIAAGSLVSLLVSEYTPLFGFMESGYRLAIVLSLLTDGLTILLLGTFLVLLALRRKKAPPQHRQPQALSSSATSS